MNCPGCGWPGADAEFCKRCLVKENDRLRNELDEFITAYTKTIREIESLKDQIKKLGESIKPMADETVRLRKALEGK